MASRKNSITEHSMPKSFETFRIKATLPDELLPLQELAYNLRWTWEHETIELFRRVDRSLWESTYHNPVRLLGTVSQERLGRVMADDGFMDQLRRVHRDLREYLDSRTWSESLFGRPVTPTIAYFSMEYGLSECLPTYSGGLGVLSGDHLKSASDLGLPLAGVGLLYQYGYFQQYLNADGWQQETYPDNDFYNLPLTQELQEDGSPVLVGVPFPGRTVYCRVWRVQVGRVPLYLLDTNTPDNQVSDRRITSQLYGGDSETRIQQELILGVGGMKALRALGIHARVCHMNEGHAAFMALERVRHRMEKDGLTTTQALEVVRAGTAFTTHTPVPAGIDVFASSLIDKYLGQYLDQTGMSRADILHLGRENQGDPNAPFNMALLALRTTAYANGVSKLHGEVSRKMWQSIWPSVPAAEVPIGHITNGIHTRSWISYEMSQLFLRYMGQNWLSKPADQSVWERVDQIPDVELWRVHERRRERLVAFTRRRLVQQLERRGANAKEIDRANEVLNPEALTIGFARRFATYKRATLLLRDVKRLTRLLSDRTKPVQFIFAGKAHPRDDGGKELIRQLVHFARAEDVRTHFVFLENYDINVARYLVQGVDVWLNNPRRPMEASGTSGMKVIPNGGLNLSVLDGWWVEGFDTDTGWAIGGGEDYQDPNYQDDVESKGMYDTIENDIVPLFYDRSVDHLPRGWIAKMKASMKKLGPVFNTNRMVREYAEHFYLRAQRNWDHLADGGFERANALASWKEKVKQHWDGVRVTGAQIERREADVGYALKVDIEVQLGALDPSDVVAQIYCGPLDREGNIMPGSVEAAKYAGPLKDGLHRYEGHIATHESGLFGYSVRILPQHEDLTEHYGLEMMRWISESAGPMTSVPQRPEEQIVVS
jgi:starch phosphorylase